MRTIMVAAAMTLLLTAHANSQNLNCPVVSVTSVLYPRKRWRSKRRPMKPTKRRSEKYPTKNPPIRGGLCANRSIQEQSNEATNSPKIDRARRTSELGAGGGRALTRGRPLQAPANTPATGLARWRTRPHLLSDLQRTRGSRSTGANEHTIGIRRSLKPRRRRCRQQISPNPKIAPSPQPAAHSCATGLRTMPAATRRALPPEPCTRAKLQNPWGCPFAIRRTVSVATPIEWRSRHGLQTKLRGRQLRRPRSRVKPGQLAECD